MHGTAKRLPIESGMVINSGIWTYKQAKSGSDGKLIYIRRHHYNTYCIL